MKTILFLAALMLLNATPLTSQSYNAQDEQSGTSYYSSASYQIAKYLHDVRFLKWQDSVIAANNRRIHALMP